MQQDPAAHTRWLTGSRLRELVPANVRPAIGSDQFYPCPWREGTRTQVFVWNLTSCLMVNIPPAEWEALPVREYLVE